MRDALIHFVRHLRDTGIRTVRCATSISGVSAIDVLDVGVRAVASGRRFRMPLAFLVLVLDDVGLPGNALLLGGALGRGERGRMGAKRLGENIAGLVGPAFIVPDDSIRDVRH